MSTPQQDALEKALSDRQRQFRRYTASKRQEFDKLCEQQPRLRKFKATLGHFTKPTDADRFLDYVEVEVRRWLGAEPKDIRFAALEAVDERCQAIRIRAGLAPIDDALPGEEPDDVFRTAKGMLGL